MINVIVKVTNILPPERIVDAIGQTLCITKALVFDKTLSIRTNFYYDFRSTSKQQNVQHFLLTDSQLQFLTHENTNR